MRHVVKLTAEDVAEFMRIYPTATFQEMQERFGLTVSAISARASRYGLKRAVRPSRYPRKEPTEQQLRWLRANYADIGNGIISIYLGVSVSTCKRWAKRYGLAKSWGFMHSCKACAGRKNGQRGKRGNSGKDNNNNGNL